MNLKPIKALTVPLVVAASIGLFAHHYANAEQSAPSTPTFVNKPAECRTGNFRVTATRFADIPSGGRIFDGRVTVETFHSKPALMVTTTKDGLNFSEVGKAGTPSALMGLATMTFDTASLTVELKNGVTTFRDSKGRSATIYGYGVKHVGQTDHARLLR